MFDRRSKAVVWNIEIDERAAHEYSGGMDLLIESLLAIDEENVEALFREQASTLKAGQSGADDRDVIARSHKGNSNSSLARLAMLRLSEIIVKYFI